MSPYLCPGASVSDALSRRSAPPPGFGSVNGPSSIVASREPVASPERRSRAARVRAASSSAASSAACAAASAARYRCFCSARARSFALAPAAPPSDGAWSYVISCAANCERSASVSRIVRASSLETPPPRDIGARFSAAAAAEAASPPPPPPPPPPLSFSHSSRANADARASSPPQSSSLANPATKSSNSLNSSSASSTPPATYSIVSASKPARTSAHAASVSSGVGIGAAGEEEGARAGRTARCLASGSAT
eukprot:29380-Pelagococcus_subviridis.AAC.3